MLIGQLDSFFQELFAVNTWIQVNLFQTIMVIVNN